MFQLLFKILLVAGAVNHHVSGITLKIEATSTLNPTVVKRDDALPTLFLGDLGQYTQPPKGNGNFQAPEKRDVTIDPSGIHDTIPEDGLHIGFGPELQKDMEDVIRSACKDQNQLDDCRGKIQELLRNTNLRTHTKRFLPLIAAATAAEIIQGATTVLIASLGAIALGLGLSKVGQNEVYYDGHRNGALDQIQSMTDASVIAIATGVDNGIIATITVTPTPIPGPPAGDTVVIEEIQQDHENRKKGDILIHIPKTLDGRLRDYLGMMGLEELKRVCGNHADQKRNVTDMSKRAPPSAECARGIEEQATRLLFETDAGAFGQLIPANMQNPLNPGVNPAGAAAPNMIVNGGVAMVEVGRLNIRRPNLSVARQNQIFVGASVAITIVTGYVFESIVDAVASLAFSDQTRLKSSDLQCPIDLVCLDDDCKGLENIWPTIPLFGPTVVQGYKCTAKETSGCYCEQVSEGIDHEAEPDHFEKIEKWLRALEDSVEHPDCDSNNWLSMNTARFNEAIDKACKDHNELRRLKARGIGKRNTFTYENKDKDNLEWKLHWEDEGDKCQLKCQDVFQKIFDHDKCRWWGGAAKKGSLPTECGEASYEVNMKVAEPLPENVRLYMLQISQEIKSGNSKIRWRLLEDPWTKIYLIEGPATYNDVGGAVFQIHIAIDEPQDKDKSKVRFTLADSFHPENQFEAPWYAGASDDWGTDNGFNRCGRIIPEDFDWRVQGGSWQRHFTCTFAHNFKEALLPKHI